MGYIPPILQLFVVQCSVCNDAGGKDHPFVVTTKTLTHIDDIDFVFQLCMGVPWVNYLVMRRSRDGIVQVFPMNYYNIFISPVLALSFDEMTVAQSSLAAAKAKCILPTNQPTAPYHK